MIFRRAHKVWLYVGGKKEEEAQYARSPKRQSVLKRKNGKSTPQSLFSPLFSTAVRSFEPQNWSVFFPFFAYRNSSFLKHRIHPKHGSGRTSSLTRSNTRKCTSSFYYFVFSVEFFFKRAKLLLFFLSVYVKKKKSQTLGLSSVRGRNAPPCFV